jgi:hypothetical protein
LPWKGSSQCRARLSSRQPSSVLMIDYDYFVPILIVSYN